MSSHARASRHAHGKWEGHDALHTALLGLASAKGTSQNRISAVAKLALQYAKFYKHVVHDVEVFLWKAEPEHRLAGLYAIDAIIRPGGTRSEAKEQYAKRFGIRLSDTLNAVKGASADSQNKVRQVIEEWQRRGIYSTNAIEAAGGYEFALRDDSPSKKGRENYSPTRSGTTPTASSGKLASLLSILKKKKEQEIDPPSSGASDQRYQRDDRQPEYDAFDQRDIRQRDPSPYRQQDRRWDEPSSGQQARPWNESSSSQQDRRQGETSSMQQGHRYHDQPGGEEWGQRTTQGIMGDAPSSLLGAGPPRGTRRDDRGAEWNDDSSRSAKKPRSSRWGPPKPAGETPVESRPPSILASAPIGTTDNRSRSSGDIDFRQSPPRVDSRAPSSFHNAQDGFRPSSDGRGPESYGRYDGSFPPPPRHNAPEGLVNHGFSSRPEDSADRFVPGSGPNSAGPSPRFADRSSLHQQKQILGKQPSGGEMCRQFLSGRCNYGDRCRYVHESQVARVPPPAPVVTESKRKTVLCNNFPLGRCRYGDNCSFAHGVEDLGSRRPQLPPATGRSGFNESPRGRWDSPDATPPMTGGSRMSASNPAQPSSSAPPPAGFPPQHLPKQNGGGVLPQAVFNEPRGRGPAGAAQMTNGGNMGPGAPLPAPPHPMGLQGLGAPYGAGPPPRGPPGPQSSVHPQAPRAVNYSAPPLPSAQFDADRSGMPQQTNAADEKTAGAVPSKARQDPAGGRLDDDDEPEAPVEEFTLQYDDDD